MQLTADTLAVTDTEDYTLFAHALKPDAIVTSDYDGVVANVQPWQQDKLYLSTATELGVALELSLIRKYSSTGSSPITSANAVHKLDQYFMGRYIQLGGVSVTFRLQLFNDTVAVTDPVDVVIPANESDDNYLTRYVSSYLTNIATALPFTLDEINALKVRITLVEV